MLYFKKIVLSGMLVAGLMLSTTALHSQPKLVKHGTTSQLVVKGQPMLMIGGEMGNSSASTLSDVQNYFPHLKALGLNTVLVPAYWELIEPQEGKFDFSTVHDVITEARKNDLKVVFLWFGAWKNSMSCYTPEWFKRDTKRFPRAHALNGRPVEEASSLSKNVLEADKRAFCNLIKYIKDNDSQDETVIMVQVENEIGMIDVPRDYSADANRLYNSPVPQQLVKYLKSHPQHPFITKKLKDANSSLLTSHSSLLTSNSSLLTTTWPQMFGDDIYTEEIFQAWTYAQYVEELAKAGKAIYNIPMYVNVALNSRNRKPGQYPSAGPLAHLVNIWQCGAPSIDIMGLDLYDKDFRGWTGKYHMPSDSVKGIYNPMFIPEIRLDDNDAVRALYAFGHHSAMGFCPFSIEDYPLYSKGHGGPQLSAADLAKDDQLNAFTSLTSNLSPLASSYRLLRQIEPLILDKQGTSDIYGVHLDNDLREQTITTADGIVLTVKHSYSLGWEPGV